MSFIIKSVSEKDYPALRRLAVKHPLLNLPPEPLLLKKKIRLSQRSFAEKAQKHTASFLFVLKHIKTGKLLGSSQISAKSGTLKNPSYSLKIFNTAKDPYLRLKKNQNGPSYLGGLILDKAYRGHAQKPGKQISLIRLLFCALCPKFFEKRLIAEVAPVLDQNGKNPFFEHFIKKRFSYSLKQIDYLTLTNKEKLFLNYPRKKILFSCLPQKVKLSLGKPGPLSVKALGLLKAEGFCFSSEVDPFDGGPYLSANIKDILLIKNSRQAMLTFSEKGPKKKWLFAFTTPSGDFTGGLLKGALEKGQLLVSQQSVKGFGLTQGMRLKVSIFPASRRN